MPGDNEIVGIGKIGVINIALLTSINIWRTFRFIAHTRKTGNALDDAFYKKLSFHMLLLLASAVDMPMYVTFIVKGQYTLTSYSFHKFESASLFAAFSITLSDWAGVLYEIQEYQLFPFLLRWFTLVGINVVYSLISLLNFIFCYTIENVDAYTHSPLYILGIFFQISVALLLTLFMLHAGLKLAWRIQGVSGGLTASSLTPSYNPYTYNHQNDFESALRNLNLVMATCAVCVVTQSVLLTLNYGLGLADKPDATVGPTLFYWACYSWLPLWGLTCSLLFLSRTHSKRRPGKQGLGASADADTESDSLGRGTEGSRNPLLARDRDSSGFGITRSSAGSGVSGNSGGVGARDSGGSRSGGFARSSVSTASRARGSSGVEVGVGGGAETDSDSENARGSGSKGDHVHIVNQLGNKGQLEGNQKNQVNQGNQGNQGDQGDQGDQGERNRGTGRDSSSAAEDRTSESSVGNSYRYNYPDEDCAYDRSEHEHNLFGDVYSPDNSVSFRMPSQGSYLVP